MKFINQQNLNLFRYLWQIISHFLALAAFVTVFASAAVASALTTFSTAVVQSLKLADQSPHALIKFFSAKCLIACLAKELYKLEYPLILNLSIIVHTEISFILGVSSTSLLQRPSSKKTAQFALSFTFPLVHFFLPDFQAEAAALAIASFVFLPPATGCFP